MRRSAANGPVGCLTADEPQIAYRYRLTRSLTDVPAVKANTVGWVLLNPSTADELVDDATIRRVKAFSTVAGFANLIVVNLFAARSTKPKHLPEMADPFGPHNAMAIATAIDDSAVVVLGYGAWLAAWNAKKSVRKLAVIDVAAAASSAGVPVCCLGHTASGHPRHPLYVHASQPLIPFEAQ